MTKLFDGGLAGMGVLTTWAIPSTLMWSASGSVMGAVLAGLIMEGTAWQRLVRSFSSVIAGLLLGEFIAGLLGYETRVGISTVSGIIAFCSWLVLKPLDKRGMTVVGDLIPMAVNALRKWLGPAK